MKANHCQLKHTRPRPPQCYQMTFVFAGNRAFWLIFDRRIDSKQLYPIVSHAFHQIKSFHHIDFFYMKRFIKLLQFLSFKNGPQLRLDNGLNPLWKYLLLGTSLKWWSNRERTKFLLNYIVKYCCKIWGFTTSSSLPEKISVSERDVIRYSYALTTVFWFGHAVYSNTWFHTAFLQKK